jgi:hypothetical protein
MKMGVDLLPRFDDPTALPTGDGNAAVVKNSVEQLGSHRRRFDQLAHRIAPQPHSAGPRPDLQPWTLTGSRIRGGAVRFHSAGREGG